MLPMVFDAVFPCTKAHFDGDHCAEDLFVDSEAHVQDAKHKPEAKVNWSLVHIFCDGVFVGVALSLCDKSTVYTIVGIKLYHEVAQELADYFLLTRHVGLRPSIALLLNFVAGLSILLGGIIVLATPVSDLSIGVILSIDAGVHLYIAACV